MSYAKVTRGKHLFGGVYETYANGDLIGVTKQGRLDPWWTPDVGPATMGFVEDEDEWSLVTSPNLHPLLMVGVAVVGLYAISKAFGMLGMERNPRVPLSMARTAGEMLDVDWDTSPFSVRDLRKGIEVEMEHGPGGPAGEHGDVTRGDMLTTAMIALGHLREFPDYYVRLARMEREAEAAYAPAEQAPWLQ